MGFYSNVLIPFFYDYSMDRPHIREGRKNMLQNVSGSVLEIGFGTGLNLPHYPASINKIVTVDKNPGMNKKALRRISESKIKIESKVLNSEKLPFEKELFDCVVSTYTLCSIKNIDSALLEIFRVLKNNGRFFFHEHGLHEDLKIQKWQNRLNPFQKVFADGCNLNRDIKLLIENAGFKFLESRNYIDTEVLKTHGFMYEGIAIK